MSTGRVLWIIWCCAWAGVWTGVAVAEWPRRVCNEFQMINPGCMSYGSSGSSVGVAVALLLVGLSVAAIALPVGKPGNESPPGG